MSFSCGGNSNNKKKNMILNLTVVVCTRKTMPTCMSCWSQITQQLQYHGGVKITLCLPLSAEQSEYGHQLASLRGGFEHLLGNVDLC